MTTATDKEVLTSHYRHAIAIQVDDLTGVEETGFEVISMTKLLWCGWEGDTHAVIVKLAGGDHHIVIVEGVGPWFQRHIEMLEERVAEYKQAIVDTEAFIERAKGLVAK